MSKGNQSRIFDHVFPLDVPQRKRVAEIHLEIQQFEVSDGNASGSLVRKNRKQGRVVPCALYPQRQLDPRTEPKGMRPVPQVNGQRKALLPVYLNPPRSLRQYPGKRMRQFKPVRLG